MYAKVFRQIYDSSIAEDYIVRLVFMDLLVLADSDGVVDMTHEAISRRTNVPIEQIHRSITALEQPDPKSRTPAENGSRIVRLDSHRDWGWLIVNYDTFRKISSEEQRKEKTKLRVSRYRSKPVTLCNDTVTPSNACNAREPLPSPSASSSKGEDARRGFSEGYPTLPEVLAKAELIGLARWRAESWFNEMEGCGWLDYRHRPIKNWCAVLTEVRTKWEVDGRPHGPPKSKSAKAEPVLNKI